MMMLRPFLYIRRNLAEKASSRKPKDVKAMAKMLSSDHDITDSNMNARFLEQSVGGAYYKWTTALDTHPELRTLKRKDVLQTIEKLRALNYTSNDIANKPMVLYNNYLTVENRHQVLLETGFNDISLNLLVKYITVINKAVNDLKKFNYIDGEVNVVEKLSNTFTDIELQLPKDIQLNESMKKGSGSRITENILSDSCESTAFIK